MIDLQIGVGSFGRFQVGWGLHSDPRRSRHGPLSMSLEWGIPQHHSTSRPQGVNPTDPDRCPAPRIPIDLSTLKLDHDTIPCTIYP